MDHTFQRINLSHLRPCHQAWEDMPALEQGRLCQQCHKTIIDFREKSDREIAEIHAFSEEPVCGLYHPHQRKLSREAPAFASKPLTWKAATLGALGLLFSEQVQAQARTAPTATEQQETPSEPREIVIPQEETQTAGRDTVRISGRLLDNESMPVPFGTVVIQELRTGTSTDQDGYFHLRIPKPVDAPETLTLRFTCIGFEAFTTQVPFENTTDYLTAFFQRQEPELSVFYIIVRRPLHKRIWDGIKGIFRKNN